MAYTGNDKSGKTNKQSNDKDLIVNLYERETKTWSEDDIFSLKQALSGYAQFKTWQDKVSIKIEKMLPKLKTISLKKGEILTDREECKKSAYLIIKGKFSVYQNLKENEYFKVDPKSAKILDKLEDDKSVDPFEEFDKNFKQKNVVKNYLADEIQNSFKESKDSVLKNQQLFTEDCKQKVLFKKNLRNGDYINDKKVQFSDKSMNLSGSTIICYEECTLLFFPYNVVMYIMKTMNEKDKNIDLAVLSKIFTNFSVKDLGKFYQHFLKQNVEKGKIVYNHGEKSEYGYILISGNIEIEYKKHNDKNIYIKYIQEGSPFGVYEFLCNLKRVSRCSIKSKVARVVYFDKNIYQKMYKLDNSIEVVLINDRHSSEIKKTEDDTKLQQTEHGKRLQKSNSVSIHSKERSRLNFETVNKRQTLSKNAFDSKRDIMSESFGFSKLKKDMLMDSKRKLDIYNKGRAKNLPPINVPEINTEDSTKDTGVINLFKKLTNNTRKFTDKNSFLTTSTKVSEIMSKLKKTKQRQESEKEFQNENDQKMTMINQRMIPMIFQQDNIGFSPEFLNFASASDYEKAILQSETESNKNYDNKFHGKSTSNFSNNIAGVNTNKNPIVCANTDRPNQKPNVFFQPSQKLSNIIIKDQVVQDMNTNSQQTPVQQRILIEKNLLEDYIYLQNNLNNNNKFAYTLKQDGTNSQNSPEKNNQDASDCLNCFRLDVNSKNDQRPPNKNNTNSNASLAGRNNLKTEGQSENNPTTKSEFILPACFQKEKQKNNQIDSVNNHLHNNDQKEQCENKRNFTMENTTKKDFLQSKKKYSVRKGLTGNNFAITSTNMHNSSNKDLMLDLVGSNENIINRIGLDKIAYHRKLHNKKNSCQLFNMTMNDKQKTFDGKKTIEKQDSIVSLPYMNN